VTRFDPLLLPDFAIGADVQTTEDGDRFVPVTVSFRVRVGGDADEVEPAHVWPAVRQAIATIVDDVNRMPGPGGPTLH
jgi:hypothetical protein